MKKPLLIYLFAFTTNLIWENLHYFLYDNYQGGEITRYILLHASVADALMITALSAPFVFWNFFRKRIWLLPVLGVILAIGIEWWALSTSRWAYNELMPIIPLIKTGLTPTIQLGLLGLLSFKWAERFLKKNNSLENSLL